MIKVQERGRDRGKILLAAAGSLVLLLALWHGLDVKDGAAQTGNTWLFGWYALVVLWALGTLALGWYVLIFERSWPLERAFLVLSLCLGMLYGAVLPPLSAPDEVSHYISAYRLSNAMLGWETVDSQGRVYIRPRDSVVEDTQDVLADDGSGRTGDEEAEVLGQFLCQDTYSRIHSGSLGKTGENQEDGPAVSYQPAVRTTPLAYVPQALGITLARLLGTGPLGLLYLGRLFNLLFYGWMGWLTIRRLPFGKELFFGVSLLPMSLNLISSMSYDVMILALAGYFTALCLDLAFCREQVGLADLIRLALVLAVMGPCKIVYSVIVGFCLLIPVKKFKTKVRWLLSALAVLGALGISMAAVNFQTVALYTGITDRYVVWAQEPGYSFAQLVHDPVLVLQMCYNTLAWLGEPLFSGLIGASLGNMDAVLSTPYPVVLALAAILVWLALKKPGEEIRFSMGQRVWIWFLCLACLGGLMFSMLLAWTPVSSDVIKGVQGRYLLPLLPVFLMTLKNRRVVRADGDDRSLLFVMAAMSLYVGVRLFAVVCLRV